MIQTHKKLLVIGGGISGLCAAVYAARSGYEVELIEQHHSAGGLAASWRRGDYTFETCLHWLVGSNPNGTLHAEWREVCDIDSLGIVDHDEFVCLETQTGESLHIYTDVDRLEAELLRVAPEDQTEIRHFVNAIRQLVDLPMPHPNDPWFVRIASVLKMLPDLPLLWRLSHQTVTDYGQRFQHPLLRTFFQGGTAGNLSALALVLSLAWMSSRNAGYIVGGSQALIRLILDRFTALGGHVRYDARAKRILTSEGVATGVQLESGETILADRIISAADGHATIHQLLNGQYSDAAFDKAFADYETFPSYLQVSLGVARDLADLPGYLTLELGKDLDVDPTTSLTSLSYRIFHYDPTFAPPGKTAVTCFLPSRNLTFWQDLRQDEPQRYQAEKHRIAEDVIAVLDHRLPGIRSAIETIDISTPATVVRYTGNWKGSMEGWLMTPATGFGSLPQTLPGLRHFAMVGQWVQPGGGLPSGLMTARAAIQAICREDHAPFLHGEAKPAPDVAA